MKKLRWDWNETSAAQKLKVAVWTLTTGFLVLGIMLLTGCGTAQQPMTKAAFQAAITLGEQFALEQHPEVVPHVRAAADVICAAANGTNASPDAIVAALQASNVTNAEAKLIVNGSLAIFDIVWPYVATNQPLAIEYSKALCDGITQGLPGNSLAKKAPLVSPAHLR